MYAERHFKKMRISMRIGARQTGQPELRSVMHRAQLSQKRACTHDMSVKRSCGATRHLAAVISGC